MFSNLLGSINVIGGHILNLLLISPVIQHPLAGIPSCKKKRIPVNEMPSYKQKLDPKEQLMTAIDTFNRTYDRSMQKVQLYRRLANLRLRQTPRRIAKEDLADIARMALVLGVSAFDHYFTSKYIDKLIPYLKKKGPNKKLIKFLEKKGLTTGIALDFLPKDQKDRRPYRKLRNFIEDCLDKYVTQRFDLIDDLFSPLGVAKLSENAERKARQTTLKKRISNTIQRRHLIVHKGDLHAYGQPREIKIDDVEKRLQAIKLFVEKCEELINDCVK